MVFLAKLCLSFICFLGITGIYAQNDCGEYVGDLSSPVKIVVYSEVGTCFKVTALGRNINPDYASRVTFGFNMAGKFTLDMADGVSFKKSVVANEFTEVITYKIKKNKKGKYIVKAVLGATQYDKDGQDAHFAEHFAKAEQDKAKREQSLEAWEDEAKQMHKDRDERLSEIGSDDKKEVQPLENAETVAATTEGDSSQYEQIEEEDTYYNPNRPENTIHLHFVQEGRPLANLFVEVTGVGSGYTDNNGDVYIDASQLRSKSIGLYAKRDDYELEASPGVVKLDDNLYARVDATELALEVMGKGLNMFKAAKEGDSESFKQQIHEMQGMD